MSTAACPASTCRLRFTGLAFTRSGLKGRPPGTEYAVNNNNTEEIAVYLGLIWRVTDGLARYGIAMYYRDQAAAIPQREPRLIDWEYEVAAEELDPGRRDA